MPVVGKDVLVEDDEVLDQLVDEVLILDLENKVRLTQTDANIVLKRLYKKKFFHESH